MFLQTYKFDSLLLTIGLISDTLCLEAGPSCHTPGGRHGRPQADLSARASWFQSCYWQDWQRIRFQCCQSGNCSFSSEVSSISHNGASFEASSHSAPARWLLSVPGLVRQSAGLSFEDTRATQGLKMWAALAPQNKASISEDANTFEKPDKRMNLAHRCPHRRLDKSLVIGIAT